MLGGRLLSRSDCLYLMPQPVVRPIHNRIGAHLLYGEFSESGQNIVNNPQHAKSLWNSNNNTNAQHTACPSAPILVSDASTGNRSTTAICPGQKVSSYAEKNIVNVQTYTHAYKHASTCTHTLHIRARTDMHAHTQIQLGTEILRPAAAKPIKKTLTATAATKAKPGAAIDLL